MAGKGGGGAWKVAYADFITAMMAFFLVMWICAQDQKVKRSVADYFSDPMGTTTAGSQKKPKRTGAVVDEVSTGKVPDEEKVAMGQGRKGFSANRKSSPGTKMVHDHLTYDKEAHQYWQKQAKDQREAARWSDDVKKDGLKAERVATRLLSKQLQDEFLKKVPANVQGLQRDLLMQAIMEVNWSEVAQELIGP